MSVDGGSRVTVEGVPATATEWIPGMSAEAYAALMQEEHPRMAGVLWLDRPGARRMAERLRTQSNEFECDATGRGDSYREAQRLVTVRATGMMRLLELAADGDPRDLRAPFKLLDVLGGDGTLARAVQAQGFAHPPAHWILTGDIAQNMVVRCLRHGLPAVRQPADFLLIRDDSLDAVLIAYGTHHIPAESRSRAFREAHRSLRPGGRLVIHDFEETSAMATWFNDVVHARAKGGHAYAHLSPEQLRRDLRTAGFREVEIHPHVYDPFIVSGPDPKSARRSLVAYVDKMYGLRAAEHGLLESLEQEIQQTFAFDFQQVDAAEPHWCTAMSVYEREGEFVAEMPRLALAAVAVKEAAS